MEEQHCQSSPEPITATEAAVREAEFLRRFQDNCRNRKDIPTPAGKRIRVRNWDNVREVGDERDRYWRFPLTSPKVREDACPRNAWIKFSLPLGRKDHLVLEARACSRVRRFQEQGVDEEPLSLGELRAQLEEGTPSTSDKGSFTVLALFSPTGWSDEATRWAEGSSPERTILFLIGPELTDIAGDLSDPRVRVYASVLGGSSEDPSLVTARAVLSDLTAISAYVTADDLADKAECDQKTAEKVLQQFAKQSPDWVVDKIKPAGTLIRRRIDS